MFPNWSKYIIIGHTIHKNPQQPIYRYDPVPKTGRGYNSYKFYKRMKTKQELTQNVYDEEYDYKIRRKRTKNYLPDSYWDIAKSRVGNKSWKNVKKRKQYL